MTKFKYAQSIFLGLHTSFLTITLHFVLALHRETLETLTIVNWTKMSERDHLVSECAGEGETIEEQRRLKSPIYGVMNDGGM